MARVLLIEDDGETANEIMAELVDRGRRRMGGDRDRRLDKAHWAAPTP